MAHPTEVVRCDNAENCRFAIAADGNGNMSTPAIVRAGKTSGEMRPDEYAVGSEAPEVQKLVRPETAGNIRRRLE
jgi:hypothetical protein